MPYTPYYPAGWDDSPSTATPIIAAALNTIEAGIGAASTAVGSEVTRAEAAETANANAISAETTRAQNAEAALAPKDLNELLIAPSGATGEVCPRNIATSTSGVPTSGIAYVRAIGLRSGIAVNNITMLTAASNILTNLVHGWYALLDSSLHVLAVSADQTSGAYFTAINTAYPLAVRGSSGSIYTTTYTGVYYIAQSVSIGTGVMPQYAASGAISAGLNATLPVVIGNVGTQAAPPAVGAQLASGTVAASNTNTFYAFTS